KPDPNLLTVQETLLRGQNHPQDIPAIIRLFGRFKQDPAFAAATALWIQGDIEIANLVESGEQLHTQISAGLGDADQERAILDQVDRTDSRLTVLETQFSENLGQISRATQRELSVVIATASLLLVFGALLILRRTLRRNVVIQEAQSTCDA